METKFSDMKRVLKHHSKSDLILMLCQEIKLKSFYKNHLDMMIKEIEEKAKENNDENKSN